MNNQLKILCLIVMAFTVSLIAVSASSYISLGRDLKDCEKQLSESRARWEKTAEEKEALQVDLKEKQDSLKEAKQSLKESTERAEELRVEIAQLKKELEALNHDGTDEQ